MNCEECKFLINVFMDNELDEAEAESVRDHLSVCSECSLVCEDLSLILDACATDVEEEVGPPNAQALWCRINNIIETEAKAAQPASVAEMPQKGRFWRLSFGQVTAALLGVAVISSLLTVVVVRSYNQPSPDDFTSRSAATQTTFERVLSRVGLMTTPQQAREARLKEQQSAIEYWNARVHERRSVWNRTTREAFDRNLRVIDESVNDYRMILQENPDDELSGEMLDAVLTDKMNLLRDFSEL